MSSEPQAALIAAARAGDQQARDQLVSAHLPLVYNIVGRALNGHADVDDVVQETMLQVVAGLGGLRAPEKFRSWLVAITMNQLRAYWRRTGAEAIPAGRLEDTHPAALPSEDFVDLAVLRLGLSGQRREVAQATRWLDEADRALLSLWWLEAAGELTRAEVAAALELTPQHTAVRVQRMKGQLDTARVLVRALATEPRCILLEAAAMGWDGAPSPLWRKRLARHTRDCTVCSGGSTDLVPAERLLVGLALVPVAFTAASASASEVAAHATMSAAYGQGAPTQGIPSLYDTGAFGTPAHGTPEYAAPLHGTPAHGSPDFGATPTAAAAPQGPPGYAPTAPAAYAEPVHTEPAYSGTGPGGPTTGPTGPTGHGGGTGARRAERLRRARRRRVTGVAAALVVLGAGGGIVYLSPGSDEDKEEPTRVEARSAQDAPKRSASPSASPSSKSPSPSASPSREKKKPAKKKRPEPTKKPERRPTTSAPAKPAPKPKPDPPKPDPAPAGTAEKVTALVNAEREKKGCGPVRLNSKLNSAALKHSADMDARDFFDHNNPDGKDPGDRVTAAGYRWSTYGENIARGQQSSADVMKGWMDSPGHRENILNCDFKEMGIGRHDGAGGPWWTQVFGAAG
ncbi:sigma-70 family RNA polymerase sigma factor [Streptomyces sp. NPDC048172]|uniref:sigma-70 family RNA polymerase sigma factor n=1 Tax=Streptomyces sp. NPDC048172 TaxID=3365505 RepID=UPI003721F57F